MPIKSRAKTASDRSKRFKEKASHMKRVASVARKKTTITIYQKMAMEILDEQGIAYVKEKPILTDIGYSGLKIET